MSFKDAQKEVDDWVRTHEHPYWPPLAQFARLAEETGEVGRVLNHLYGSKPKKEGEAEQHLDEELADVLFTIICMANSEDINLDEAFAKVMHKCRTRDKDRFTKKDTK